MELPLPFTAAWEAAWAPYDEDTYGAALDLLRPEDVVLDIGAGDLRFARRAANRARAVYAVERCRDLLAGPPLPPNLVAVWGDARSLPLPAGLTVAVLLMRHCAHFAHYAARLRAAGCHRLITNARWGMGVELVSLAAQPPFAAIGPGWYACLCGRVGFKPGAPAVITSELLTIDQPVGRCPACSRLVEEESPWSES